MISRKYIITAMVVEDMSDISLYNKISEYKNICMADVTAIINDGIKGYLEDYERVVAYILGLKKYFPEGWKPVLRVHISKLRRILPKSRTMDLFNTVTNRGDAHYTRRDNVHLIPESILQGIRMKRGNKWSGDEMAVVCRLYQTGMMPRSIAKAIGRTKSAVETKLNRMGVSKR